MAATVLVAGTAVVSQVAGPSAAAVPMVGAVTTVAVATAEDAAMVVPTMAVADIMADAIITRRVITVEASVLASMLRPAMDTHRRFAALQASTTKAAIGIFTLVALRSRTAIKHRSLMEGLQDL